MGVYNGSQTIVNAIGSIINQDFLDWEFIICDDASTDDTWEVLSQYHNNPKIIVIRNDKNQGLGYSLNQCLSLASGKYLARMDADDVSYPNRLREQFEFLESNPEIDVLGTYATFARWGVLRPVVKPVLNDWLAGSCVIHASVMMIKKRLISAGGYDPKALRIEDYDLWLRMLFKGYEIQTLPLELYDIHWSQGNYRRKKMYFVCLTLNID